MQNASHLFDVKRRAGSYGLRNNLGEQFIGSPSLILHASNITGLGASQLCLSLLPALERTSNINLSKIYLPPKGELSIFHSLSGATLKRRLSWFIPNSVYRFIECYFFTISDKRPLLVLGDIPLRYKGPQILFIQQSFLLDKISPLSNWTNFKFWIACQLFKLNLRHVDAIVVQTSLMRSKVMARFPAFKGQVFIVAHPPPAWLVSEPLRYGRLARQSNALLKLFYPAAFYYHKNYRLLSEASMRVDLRWPVDSLKVTITSSEFSNPAAPWIEFVGHLSGDEMIRKYREVDGLLFLSTNESFGFPLVEAMFIGIPIICPDLPYSRLLCGDEAIYFDPSSIDSLCVAINELHARLSSGWWPNWKDQIKDFPRNWDVVAEQFCSIVRQLPPP